MVGVLDVVGVEKRILEQNITAPRPRPPAPSVDSTDLPDRFQSTTISFSILDDVDPRHHIQPFISLAMRAVSR